MKQYDHLPARVRTARILKCLVKNGVCTVRQIAKYLGNISENWLYKILTDLRNEGLVEFCGWTTGIGYASGRTAKLYKASDNNQVKELVRFIQQ